MHSDTHRERAARWNDSTVRQPTTLDLEHVNSVTAGVYTDEETVSGVKDERVLRGKRIGHCAFYATAAAAGGVCRVQYQRTGVRAAIHLHLVTGWVVGLNENGATVSRRLLRLLLLGIRGAAAEQIRDKYKGAREARNEVHTRKPPSYPP